MDYRGINDDVMVCARLRVCLFNDTHIMHGCIKFCQRGQQKRPMFKDELS